MARDIEKELKRIHDEHGTSNTANRLIKELLHSVMYEEGVIRRFKFSSVYIIEARTKEEALHKLKENSSNFTADAVCEEL